VGENTQTCIVRHILSCIDKEGASCENKYETCDFEEYGYEKGGLVYPPLRCASCRAERKALKTTSHKCPICGKVFIIRDISKKYWKTHGIAQPPDYLIRSAFGTECPRCRNLDEQEKLKAKKLFEMKEKGIVSQEKMVQLLRSKNNMLLQKIIEDRLRKIDVAPVVSRYDEKGHLAGFAYRKGKYTEVTDATHNVLFRIYHKGRCAVLINPKGEKVGYTFTKVPFIGKPYLKSYSADLKKVTSYTFEKSSYNVTYDGSMNAVKGKSYAGKPGLF
jgi:predicted RNA-binding Zn-ribbon protein involved in translation (DUF1610 family)